MRLNMEKEEAFTVNELNQVASDHPSDASMQRVISRVLGDRIGPFKVRNIIDAGIALNLESAASAMIRALRANRRLESSPSRENLATAESITDDYTITIGELRATFRRAPEWVRPAGTADAAADWLAKEIEYHREPAWEAGDVVRDANGKFWKRTHSGMAHAWATFESGLYSSFDTPKRPLRKIGKDG